MSGFKNSPFSKRLRASHRDGDLDEGERSKKPRVNPIFGVGSSSSSSSTPALDSRCTTESSSGGPESPVDLHRPSFTVSGTRMPRIQKDYGDRFVPSKDTGDMRTSYHLMEEGGAPLTPSKSRIIPLESDALKGQYLVLLLDL
jgi:cell division cycle 20-like protein 1 (cofactor of APC complex)